MSNIIPMPDPLPDDMLTELTAGADAVPQDALRFFAESSGHAPARLSRLPTMIRHGDVTLKRGVTHE